MKKLFLIALLAVMIVGCDDMPRYKTSDVKEETAEVIAMSYVPRRTTLRMSTRINMHGNLEMFPSSYTLPEVYAVTLRCSEHKDTFTLQSEELFKKVKQGQIITLKYVDEIRYYVKTHREKDYRGRYTRKRWTEVVNEEVTDHHTVKIIFPDNTEINR